MNVIGSNHKKFDAVVCLSAIDWDFLWQRTQEIMTQFSRMGYPVLFVENTGVRTPGLKDIPRVLNRLRKLVTPVPAKSQQAYKGNIEVLSPRALPLPYFKPAICYNTRLLSERILRFAKSNNIRVERILLWSYMTTPLAVELAKSFPWAGVVVDLVSDPCKVKGARGIVESHRQMLNLADAVLCASVPVMNVAKSHMSPESHSKIKLFEDGFSTKLFEVGEESDPTREESVLLKLREDKTERPIVAYIGGINNKIWWDAVNHMVTSLPDINFVFAGPKEYSELPCSGVGKNVFWQPPFKNYVDVGRFLKKCSIGLIPYIQSPYVAEMRPAKINEYIVTGLPIVSTMMPELKRFSQENGPGIVYLAQDAGEFVSQLKKALNEDNEVYRRRRRELSEKNSWEIVCKNLLEELHRLLGGVGVSI